MNNIKNTSKIKLRDIYDFKVDEEKKIIYLKRILASAWRTMTIISVPKVQGYRVMLDKNTRGQMFTPKGRTKYKTKTEIIDITNLDFSEKDEVGLHYAFCNNNKVKIIIMPSKMHKVHNIEGAMKLCTNLEKIVFHENTKAGISLNTELKFKDTFTDTPKLSKDSLINSSPIVKYALRLEKEKTAV